jgi:hypothetical protein
MAAYEGIRRIKMLGKLFVFGGIGSAVILGGSLVVTGFTRVPLIASPGILLPLTIPMILLGGALWILGWILEGFFIRE